MSLRQFRGVELLVGMFLPQCLSFGPNLGHQSVSLSLPSHEGFEETCAEERARLFWQQTDPFQVASGVVQRVLTKDACVPPIRLLQPVSGDKNHAILEPFVSFYCGELHSTVPVVDIEPSRDTKKKSFRLDLAYAGQHFCGWQRQPNNPNLLSVQECIENAIGSADFWPCGGPIPDVRVSGRTDAGVHAIGQVARVRIPCYNHDTVLTSHDLMKVLEESAKASNYIWRCLAVTSASEAFHPTFDSKGRSYVYLIDADSLYSYFGPSIVSDSVPDSTLERWIHEVEQRLNVLMAPLVGQELDYFAFSYGKVATLTTLCRLHSVRARVLVEGESSRLVLAMELTGDRFLRRMVRILVATALQIALDEERTSDATQVASLVDICWAKDRRRSAKAAPPGGLIFVGADV